MAGGEGGDCKNAQFNALPCADDNINSEFCRDYQEIKIQENVGNLNMGTIPRSIIVTLEVK